MLFLLLAVYPPDSDVIYTAKPVWESYSRLLADDGFITEGALPFFDSEWVGVDGIGWEGGAGELRSGLPEWQGRAEAGRAHPPPLLSQLAACPACPLARPPACLRALLLFACLQSWAAAL